MRRAFSVAVYARHAARVLVIEHRRLNTWLPIGGEIESGEPPPEAARREPLEEPGREGTFRPLADPLDGVPAGLIREDLVTIVNKKARALDLPVYAVFCQAQLHLTEIFAPASVARVYVNFPDPWFKRRHHVRRMVDAVLAAQIARVVRPGSELFVQ